MVRLNRIYTRGGDSGKTSLGNGHRVPKHTLRVEAFGTVDEANAIIGCVRLHTSGSADQMLERIQHDLFDIGADLCTPEGDTGKSKAGKSKQRLRIAPAQVIRLETEIDALNERLAPLESFVLPGGTAGAAHMHLARTVVRRAERLVAELAEQEPVNEEVLRYLNRLSDHLFVLARHLNRDGEKDVLWQPGANR